MNGGQKPRERSCEVCGRRVRHGERRRRCHRCGRLAGLCCQGDLQPFEWSGCYSKGHFIGDAMSMHHQS